MPRLIAPLTACALTFASVAAPAFGNPPAPSTSVPQLSGSGQVGIVSAGLQASGLIVTFALPNEKSDPVTRRDTRIVTPADLVDRDDPALPFGKVIERES